ncbi:L-idonate 5-dehydrogenase [Cohaesibacter sp. ES.047]|uniref:L-idonate 5-dehydrogenase n=1 Tax=Cohaesibacter sp. ES.047 TaxID=1798205 RepID=UPI000BB6D0E4|nr:L-idonate 5-dehydrogenase [Cohaesibacter sp. ES.047]
MQAKVCRLLSTEEIRIDTVDVEQPKAGEVLIALGHGGICGSDLHYYKDGGFGAIRVREPIILGHEAAGTVMAVGEGCSTLSKGDVVSINPSQPCGQCKFCKEGKYSHCLNMEFMGSALRFPHCQGLFRQQLVVPEKQCHRFSKNKDTRFAACSEPLAVCLHAISRAGDLKGKKVLVTGAGPIGLLCALVASAAEPAELVVTDLEDHALDVATKIGATEVINIGSNPERLAHYANDKGTFDVAFECSAAPSAIRSAIETVRPLGTIVQVGVSGDRPIPINTLVGKEINFIGTHRFYKEFAEAVELIDNGVLDLSPVITHVFPLSSAKDAFDLAGDRSQTLKVLISFADEQAGDQQPAG